MVEFCLLIEAIMCTIPIFFIVFIRNQPKVAPNAAEVLLFIFFNIGILENAQNGFHKFLQTFDS